MREAGKVRVQQEEIVDQRKLLTSPPEALVGMDRSELTRAPSDARVEHEGKLTGESMEDCYLSLPTTPVFL